MAGQWASLASQMGRLPTLVVHPTQRSHRKEGACGAAEAAACGHASPPVQMRYVPSQNGLSSAESDAAPASTQVWPLSGLSVSGVIELARWGPMACMAAHNVSMAPGAAPPGSWADRIVCHSAARAHGWRYCLVIEGLNIGGLRANRRVAACRPGQREKTFLVFHPSCVAESLLQLRATAAVAGVPFAATGSPALAVSAPQACARGEEGEGAG